MPRKTLRRKARRGGAPAGPNNVPKGENNNNSIRACCNERDRALEMLGQKNLEIRSLNEEISNLNNLLQNARNPRANAGLMAARLNSTVRRNHRIPFAPA